jgi:hypothetical protein
MPKREHHLKPAAIDVLDPHPAKLVQQLGAAQPRGAAISGDTRPPARFGRHSRRCPGAVPSKANPGRYNGACSEIGTAAYLIGHAPQQTHRRRVVIIGGADVHSHGRLSSPINCQGGQLADHRQRRHVRIGLHLHRERQARRVDCDSRNGYKDAAVLSPRESLVCYSLESARAIHRWTELMLSHCPSSPVKYPVAGRSPSGGRIVVNSIQAAYDNERMLDLIEARQRSPRHQNTAAL